MTEAAKNAAQPIYVVECRKWRFTSYHSTPANNSSLTGVGMSLVLMKHTYPCFTAFIMTEHWLKQPKMLPSSHVVVECQKWRCSNHHKTPAYKPSLTGVEMRTILHIFKKMNYYFFFGNLLESTVQLESISQKNKFTSRSETKNKFVFQIIKSPKKWDCWQKKTLFLTTPSLYICWYHQERYSKIARLLK